MVAAVPSAHADGGGGGHVGAVVAVATAAVAAVAVATAKVDFNRCAIAKTVRRRIAIGSGAAFFV